MKPSPREKIASLIEDLLDPERAALFEPIEKRATAAVRRRFELQQRHLLRHGLPKVRRAFREAAPTGTDAMLQAIDTFTSVATDAVINRLLINSVLAGMRIAAKETKFDMDFTSRSEPVRKYLQQRSAQVMGRDVDETTKKNLRALLEQGYSESWTFARVKREVRALYSGFTRERAEVIAVHEMGNAFSAGALEFDYTVAATGATVEKSWMLTAGACPICQLNAGAGWIGLARTFPSGHAAPLAHVRCRCSLASRVVD